MPVHCVQTKHIAVWPVYAYRDSAEVLLRRSCSPLVKTIIQTHAAKSKCFFRKNTDVLQKTFDGKNIKNAIGGVIFSRKSDSLRVVSYSGDKVRAIVALHLSYKILHHSKRPYRLSPHGDKRSKPMLVGLIFAFLCAHGCSRQDFQSRVVAECADACRTTVSTVLYQYGR